MPYGAVPIKGKMNELARSIRTSGLSVGTSCPSICGVEMNELDLLGTAAYVWWKNLRPAYYTVEEHLKNPTVNTRGADEFDLATAVANWVGATVKEWAV